MRAEAAARSAAARRPNGGGAAWIRLGKKSRSSSRPRGSLPGIDFARKKAGRGSPTEGAKLGAELDEGSNGGRRLGLTSAGVGHGRARGGMEELRGEVAQLGVRRIEVGRRGLAGATSDGDFARFCSLELDLAQRKEEGGWGRHGKLRGVRERRRVASARLPTRGRARRRPRRRYGRRGTVSSTEGALFVHLNDFSPSLTS